MVPSADGGWLAVLDGRLRDAVRRAASLDVGGDDSLRGLYISDDQALALAAAVAPPGADERLTEAAERLALDPLDAAVLTVCAAPDLDPRFGRLYAYLHDDVTRKRASPRLVAELLAGDGVGPDDVLACLGPEGRLARTGAIIVVPDDPLTPLADRPTRLADRLAAHVLGAPSLASHGPGGRLREVRPDPVITGRVDAAARIAGLLRDGTGLPLVVCGPDAPAVVSAAVGCPVLLLDAAALEHPGALADATLAGLMQGALPCIDGLEHLDPAGVTRLARAVAGHSEQVVLVAATSDVMTKAPDGALLIDVVEPSFAERRSAWTELAGIARADDVAAKFRLSIEQIRAGAHLAQIQARERGATVPEPSDLDAGARHASSSRLGELAARLPVRMGWDDLVLPDRQKETLRSIAAYLRHRDRVLSDWGYDRTVARTQGLKVLFAGESGTGKTMGAEVVAAGLGLELFRVDLATVVSKYIGETEKNLERIFGAAHGSNAILFFDEADALFGKRSDVSDSHDRYANIEVSYLLQRMEGYPGAVVLATNYKQNIDDAFLRRLDFVVDFPFPEADDRRRIWDRVLPDEAPRDHDVDLDFLAERFKLSGGAIRNCSLAAAFQAADDTGVIGMAHLIRAVAQEYAKQGRLTLQADFAEFHELVRVSGATASVS